MFVRGSRLACRRNRAYYVGPSVLRGLFGVVGSGHEQARNDDVAFGKVYIYTKAELVANSQLFLIRVFQWVEVGP